MFSKIAKVLAILIVVLGGLRIAMAFYVLQFADVEAATRRYIGSGTPGEAIDRGIYMILFGVVLGVLSEIGGRRPQ